MPSDHQPLSTGIRQAIRNVVAYNWRPEQADFDNQDQDRTGQTHHIFNDLSLLRTYLDTHPPHTGHDADRGRREPGAPLGPDRADLAAADDPTPLRWGLDDVLYGDDDTVTVLLADLEGAPYWLTLDPERAAALRESLTGPGPDETTAAPARP
ncbi:hypothetical protein ABT160_46780 [Streptomyces sp. NPDC001941]|uniref:hypothetical protein n=1 Tax=Streptomyces sp. NPDC001941 TaxID=3154659 RepID=UPI00332D2B41